MLFLREVVFILYTSESLHKVLKKAVKRSYNKSYTTVNELHSALVSASGVTEKYCQNQRRLVKKIADTAEPKLKKYLTDLYDQCYAYAHTRDRAITYSRLFNYEEIGADACFKFIEIATLIAHYNGIVETAIEFIEMTKRWEEEDTQSEDSIGETCTKSCC